MNYSKYRFNLDMQSYISQISLPVRQNDTGISLRINLTDGGIPYTINDGCVAMFFARKSDGNPLLNYCLIENNTTICYELTQQTTACSGVVDCEIRLYGPDGSIITTPRFILVVDSRVVSGSDFVPSDGEMDVLDNILISEAERQGNETKRQKTYEEMLDTIREASEFADIVTEKLAAGEFSPHIGENGNWWVNEKDTGVLASDHAIPLRPGQGYYNLIQETTTEPNKAEGDFSSAFGEGTEAIGSASHTEGYKTKVIYAHGHAEGRETTAGSAAHSEGAFTTASGVASHAEGNGTTAEGAHSHAEGLNSIAKGEGSHAEGRHASALGDWSHAEGFNPTASGSYSHAEGVRGVASGSGAHVEGWDGRASAQGAHAEGLYSVASNDCAHAEGSTCEASGVCAHAEGYNTKATATASHSGGYKTVASAESQTAIGKYNKENPNALFIVGNGADENNPSNAFEVLKESGIVVGDTVLTEATVTALLNLLKFSPERWSFTLDDGTVVDKMVLSKDRGTTTFIVKGTTYTATEEETWEEFVTRWEDENPYATYIMFRIDAVGASRIVTVYSTFSGSYQILKINGNIVYAENSIVDGGVYYGE